MEINFKRIIKVIFVYLLLCTVLYLCIYKKSESHYDFDVSNNLQQMIEKSDTVVLGTVQENTGTWNMSRDLDDVSKDSEIYYTEGRLSLFQIDEVLKGTVTENRIMLTQRYSDNYSGTSKKDPLYVPLETGSSYILFLKYNEQFNLYYGTTEPYILSYQDGRLSILTRLTEIVKDYEIPIIPKSLDEIKRICENEGHD